MLHRCISARPLSRSRASAFIQTKGDYWGETVLMSVEVTAFCTEIKDERKNHTWWCTWSWVSHPPPDVYVHTAPSHSDAAVVLLCLPHWQCGRRHRHRPSCTGALCAGTLMWPAGC